MQPEPCDGYFWQGAHVRLRPLRIADAEKKWREWTDSEARLMLESGLDLPPVSLEAYTEKLKPWCEFENTSQGREFAIETLAGEFVGWINLFDRDERHGTFGFGVSIFREHQRQGYAEEALRILLRYMFFERRFQKCNSACLDLNAASLGLHRKLGFVEEGRRRRVAYAHGAYHDEVLLGLLKEEFEADDGG
jgi:RimJ/RimL family protein N-acetyltransferase